MTVMTDQEYADAVLEIATQAQCEFSPFFFPNEEGDSQRGGLCYQVRIFRFGWHVGLLQRGSGGSIGYHGYAGVELQDGRRYLGGDGAF